MLYSLAHSNSTRGPFSGNALNTRQIVSMLDRAQFLAAFSTFTTLYLKHNDGHPFISLNEGMAYTYEDVRHQHL